MSKSSTTTKGVAAPNRVTTHPGEVLSEEFLKPLGMSVNALALALRVPATVSAPSSRASAQSPRTRRCGSRVFSAPALNSGSICRPCMN